MNKQFLVIGRIRSSYKAVVIAVSYVRPGEVGNTNIDEKEPFSPSLRSPPFSPCRIKELHLNLW